MLQLGGRADFPEEPAGTDRSRNVGAEDFDRDQAIMLQVPREIHRRHPTATELALNRVAAGEGGSESVEDLWQVS